jgi:hypothetical protein
VLSANGANTAQAAIRAKNLVIWLLLGSKRHRFDEENLMRRLACRCDHGHARR